MGVSDPDEDGHRTAELWDITPYMAVIDDESATPYSRLMAFGRLVLLTNDSSSGRGSRPSSDMDDAAPGTPIDTRPGSPVSSSASGQMDPRIPPSTLPRMRALWHNMGEVARRVLFSPDMLAVLTISLGAVGFVHNV